MASLRRILRSRNDVTLTEENIYILIPYLTIETAYIVTSQHLSEGVHFSELSAAMRQFKLEIERSVHSGPPLPVRIQRPTLQK